MLSSIDLLIAHKVVSPEELRPCLKAEIDELAVLAGGSLPKAYVDFLRVMGRGAGKFMACSDFFYPDLLDLGRAVEELIAERPNELVLPDGSFVISLHQGYEYKFFVLGEGDDPPVYQCVEGQRGVAFRWPRFTDLLSDLVKEYVD